MLFKIVPKVLVDVGVLGRCREEIFFFVLMVLGFVGGDVSKDVETKDGGRRDGSTGNNIGRAVRDVKEGMIFLVVKDRPSKLGGWGTRGKDNR